MRTGPSRQTLKWLIGAVAPALVLASSPGHSYEQARDESVIVPAVAMISSDYWEAPRATFQRLSGEPTPDVRATVFPQPAELGASVYVVVRHPDTLRVLRIRVDLGVGPPHVDEYPEADRGRTVTSVDIPGDHPVDSMYVTIWLPGETLTKAIAIVADRRSPFGRMDESIRVDELPEAIVKAAPAYPEDARDVEGTVMIQALVGADGLVHDTRVVKSVPGLDEAAAEAVRRWRFKPARSAGVPVGIWVAVPVRFSRH